MSETQSQSETVLGVEGKDDLILKEALRGGGGGEEVERGGPGIWSDQKGVVILSVSTAPSPPKPEGKPLGA
jgi:hypothetical protein